MENKDLRGVDRKYNPDDLQGIGRGSSFRSHIYFMETLKEGLEESKLRNGEFKNFFGFGRKEKGLFWFRFKHNNKGFHIKNTKLHPETFSERINIKGSGFSIGNWHFKWLKKYAG